MNKALLFISIGAMVIIYFAFSRKPESNQPEVQKQKPQLQTKQHHLTNAFANAKKHAVR